MRQRHAPTCAYLLTIDSTQSSNDKPLETLFIVWDLLLNHVMKWLTHAGWQMIFRA